VAFPALGGIYAVLSPAPPADLRVQPPSLS